MDNGSSIPYSISHCIQCSENNHSTSNHRTMHNNSTPWRSTIPRNFAYDKTPFSLQFAPRKVVLPQLSIFGESRASFLEMFLLLPQSRRTWYHPLSDFMRQRTIHVAHQVFFTCRVTEFATLGLSHRGADGY